MLQVILTEVWDLFIFVCSFAIFTGIHRTPFSRHYMHGEICNNPLQACKFYHREIQIKAFNLFSTVILKNYALLDIYCTFVPFNKLGLEKNLGLFEFLFYIFIIS